MRRPLLGSGALTLVLGACASVQPAALSPLDDPSLAGAQWGIAVARLDGAPLLMKDANQRFLPASNVKIFTTAAAIARLAPLEKWSPGTRAHLEAATEDGLPDVVLVGGGDPALSDDTDCAPACLEDLARALAGQGVTTVNNVIGDISLFPDEPHPPGWSWDDLQWRYGAQVSALTFNGNTAGLTIIPGEAVGSSAEVLFPGDLGMAIENRLMTQFEESGDYTVRRPIGSDTVILSGDVRRDTPPREIGLALSDPAFAAASRFKRALEAEGIAVLGTVTTRSEPSPASPAISNAVVLAPSPLEPALEAVMVDSDNLIAELILRHLGSLEGAPTTEGGLAVLDATLAEAGISAAEYDFSDGSGLSIYNRITPAATLRFLLWTQRQPWGEHFLATFPTGGRDGTLEQRFTGTALEGRIRAKTGTLFGANTLSGFLDTSRGDTLAFSVMVNDRDAEAGSAREEIDAVLLAIAAEN